MLSVDKTNCICTRFFPRNARCAFPTRGNEKARHLTVCFGKKNNAALPAAVIFYLQKPLSVLCGSTYGAGVCTSAAINASILVDNVFAVALAYSFNGAACRACASGDAFIGNFVCHCEILLLMV